MKSFGIHIWKQPWSKKRDIHYAWGWITGKDGGLVCILPDITDEKKADLLLSPSCYGKITALLAFLCKRFLLSVDLTTRLRVFG